jgi:hypothetical protein
LRKNVKQWQTVSGIFQTEIMLADGSAVKPLISPHQTTKQSGEIRLARSSVESHNWPCRSLGKIFVDAAGDGE